MVFFTAADIRIGAGAALLLFGSASSAWGQISPPGGDDQASDSKPAAQDDEIIVVADPSQRSSIDRTTYTIRDTAEARSASTFDLLERIPSVDVTATGQVRLFGRSGVKILIDGNEVANPQAVLRNMQGSQIARIEVISNPSAQFSAQGTGGVINIILRRSFASGLAGSATGNVGSFGSYGVRVSPTWSQGRWSVSGGLGASRGTSPSDFEIRRATLGPNGGTVAETFEQGSKRTVARSLTGSFGATYRPSTNQSLTVTANLVHADGVLTSHSDFTEIPSTGAGITQTSSGTLNLATRDLGFDYRRTFGREGETLTLSARQSDSEVHSATAYSTRSALGGPRVLSLGSDSFTNLTSLRLDYVLPFGPKRRLSMGGAIQRQGDRIFSLAAGQSPLGSGSIAESSTIKGSWTQTAVYVTYQFPWLGGVLLAGLRLEDRSYDVNGQAAGTALRQTNLFPSLHAERPVASWLTAALSYSRRIEWPSVAELDPALRYSDSTTARTGDPLLLPQITDAYEVKLKGQFSGHSVELTGFSRRTEGYRTSASALNSEGIFVLQPINLGPLVSRGVNFEMRGPVARGLSYTVSGNLSDEQIGDAGAFANLVRTGPRYDVSAQLEYRDGAEGKRNSDRIEIRARYSGPFDTGLIGISSFTTANAVWSHAYTDRLSGVLTLSDFIGPPTIRTRYFSETLFSRQVDRAGGPRVTFSLTFSLGSSAPR
jgi:outer membrane receptor protein involved in Fe transport